MLRRIGLLRQQDGESVFRLVFYLFTPVIMFTSLSTVELSTDLVAYPVAASAIIALGYASGRIAAVKARLDPVQTAVMVSGCMIVNTSFQLPFVQVLYGAEGVARVAAFDIVNSTATFTLAYLVAARGNPTTTGGSIMPKRVLTSPVPYAIVAGLGINLAGIEVPPAVADPLHHIGAATAVVIPIGIGILFNPVGGDLRKAGLMVAIRLSTGVAAATAIVLLLGLTGVDRMVLLILGAAPLVFAVASFASLEQLDVRLATNALSLSFGVSLAVTLTIIVVAG